MAGCHGCASGPGGQRNIFGNKYGQYLAAIHMARKHKQLAEHAARGLRDAREAAADADGSDSEGEGPAGIWAQNEEEAVLGPGDDAQVLLASLQHSIETNSQFACNKVVTARSYCSEAGSCRIIEYISSISSIEIACRTKANVYLHC